MSQLPKMDHHMTYRCIFIEKVGRQQDQMEQFIKKKSDLYDEIINNLQIQLIESRRLYKAHYFIIDKLSLNTIAGNLLYFRMSAFIPQLQEHRFECINLNFSKKPFCNYYCGCGWSLKSESYFKEHVCNMHNGSAIKGSSHYVSALLRIVLPVLNSQKSRLLRKTSVEISANVGQTIILSDDSNEQIQPQLLQNSGIEIFPVQKDNIFGAKSNSVQIAIKKIGEIAQTNQNLNICGIKCQQGELTLIPNIQFHQFDYFCGKCQKHISNQKLFCHHLINQCFGLKHKNSSHFLQLIDPTQNHSTPQIINYFEHISDNKLTTQKFEIPLQKCQILRSPYRRSVPQNLLGIFQKLRDRVQNKSEVFTCACGKNIKFVKHIIRHLATYHNKNIPEHSSHVLLRTGSFDKYPYYLKLKITHDNDQRLIWSCPCQNNNTVNKQTFIEHIMNIHQGISPLFKIIASGYGN